MSDSRLLTTGQMAQFAARGFLRFDAIVPESLNQAFLDDIGHTDDTADLNVREHYARIMSSSSIPAVPPGTALDATYPPDSPMGRILALPEVAGAVQSLVGENCLFDHHFLHLAFPPHLLGKRPLAQHTHQDSTIDPRQAFDLQIMYYPQDVTADMGGTRFIPGTHLRVVSEAAISRYQNMLGQQHVVCEPGTILFLHHGVWHGGGANNSDRLRYMFKIRLCPTAPQVRLWDTSDLNDAQPQRPIYWLDEQPDPNAVHTVLTTPEPWQENDTGRLDYLNRIRFWRHLTGDKSFDADYWLTRVENEQA